MLPVQTRSVALNIRDSLHKKNLVKKAFGKNLYNKQLKHFSLIFNIRFAIGQFFVKEILSD